MREGFERILIIKLRYIGDVLLATPVIRNLRWHFPRAHLAMVVNAGTEVILRHNRCVDEVLAIDRGSAKSWNPIRRFRAPLGHIQWVRARRFDCVIDLTDGDRSALLAFASGARTRVGFRGEGRWRKRLYTHLVTADWGKGHNVEYQLEALRAMGLEVQSGEPELPLAPEDEVQAAAWLARQGVREDTPFLAVHPGARWWFKQWPAEKWADLANRVQTEDGLPVIFLGGDQEGEFLGRIRAEMRTAFRGGAGQLEVLEMGAVLRRARAFVGNDNGPMHMAAALGTPVVALFGPSDPRQWGPRGTGHRVIHKGAGYCKPCIHPRCVRGKKNCLRMISVEEVAEAVRAQLAEAGSRGTDLVTRPF